MFDDSTSQLIERKDEDLTSLLIEQKDDIPEQPRYMKEKNISFYTATVFSTIIVLCAVISLIVNIKRKSKTKIILSIVLPIVAVIAGQILEKIVLLNVLNNGTEASSGAYIITTITIMTVILFALAIMIFKRNKK